MTQDTEYKPLLPEEDLNLLSNPHYWLYKVTRDALDNPNHPLAGLGHIWNRWACEGLSEEEEEELGIRDKYPSFYNLDNIPYLEKIREHINYEIEYFKINSDVWNRYGHGFLDKQKEIDFQGTEFKNKVDFSDFIFLKNANFLLVKFNQYANFSAATFKKDANFCQTIFLRGGTFNNYIEDLPHNTSKKFFGYVNFRNAIFFKEISFKNVTFTAYTHFYNTTFMQNANFNNATFAKNSNFHKSTFAGNAIFKHSKFKQNADFWGATFCETVDFSKSEFMGDVIKFNQCKFIKPTNEKTEFDFKNTVFATKVNFSESEFHHLPNLTGTDFRGGINLDKVVFLKSPPPVGEGGVGDTIIESGGHNVESGNENPPPNLPQRGRDNIASPPLESQPQRERDNNDNTPPVSSNTINDQLEHRHCEEGQRPDVAISFKPLKYLFSKDFLRDCHTSLRSFAMTAYAVLTGLLRPVSRTRNDDTASPPPSLPQRGRDNSDILGGLPPKDAAVTWHALSTEMEKAGYHDQSLEYFGYELDAKRLNPDTDIVFKCILGVYKHISHYGKSLARPFMAWCFLICAFFSIYSPIIFSNTKTLLPYYALKFAFKGAFPFVSDQTTFFDRIFGGENNHLISGNNYLELLIFPFLYGIHTLLSLILIFLFGLGVRNRLRLR